jgi:hypothetical protein
MFEMKVFTFVGMTSAGGILAQMIPVVPQDFKTWPVTAMLGFLVLCALALCFYVMKSTFANQTRATEALVKVTEAQKETNKKLFDVVTEMRDTNINLAGRPCLNKG